MARISAALRFRWSRIDGAPPEIVIPSIAHLAVLLSAAFFAGALNAAAGGGTFLTLPALMFAGLPPVAANATGSVALLPGYVASTFGFREDLHHARPAGFAGSIAAAIAGGALGAVLLIVTPDHAFRSIVPWLMLVATLLFAFGPWLLRRLHRDRPAGATAFAAGVLATSIYGGHFNGGLGVILLAVLGLLGQTDLNFMNGYKNLVSAILTAIATVVYALGGAVAWLPALIMMLAAIAGGYVGARAARRMSAGTLRLGIVAVGVVTTVWFFVSG